MSITPEKCAQLREVAQNATIGPPIGTATFSRENKGVVAWDFEAKTIHAGDYQFFKHFPPAKVLQLLDALENAEARAEQAEAERDVLAEILSEDGDCPATLFDVCPEVPLECQHRADEKCWTFWARQEAAKLREEK